LSYTHIIVKMKSESLRKSACLIEIDLDENFVVEHIIKPYIAGGVIFVDGTRAEYQNIEKISVFSSDEEMSQLQVEHAAHASRKTPRERASRLLTRSDTPSPVMTILKSEAVTNSTRKVFNEALGIQMVRPCAKSLPAETE